MEQEKITSREALNVLAQAAAAYKGTLQEHSTLQTAIQVIDELVKSQEENKDSEQE